MAQNDLYDLPAFVGDQYMLTSIVRETRDTILYRATQRELRRDVIVENLRRSVADDSFKEKLFLDSARAQARFQGQHLSRVLEVMQADGSWLVAKEASPGEPLDMMLSDGKLLSTAYLCRLLILLCKLCLRLDAERVASARFHLEDIFFYRGDFHFSNPARAGVRASSASRKFLADAARELLPLLDMSSPMAADIASVLRRMSVLRDSSPLRPALFLAELSRLHTLTIAADMLPTPPSA